MKNLVRVLLILCIASISHATFVDDFESYNKNDVLATVASDTYMYLSNAGYIKQINTTLNATKALTHGAAATGSYITRLKDGAMTPLAGEVVMTLDFLPLADGGKHVVYLAGSESTMASEDVYVAFIEDGSIQVGGGGNTTLTTLTNGYSASNWYRITFTATIDAANGSNSATDVEIYNLSTSSVVGGVTDFDFDGTPTSIASMQIQSKIKAARFDNLAIVPEPATMALLTLGGSVVLLRRKKIC